MIDNLAHEKNYQAHFYSNRPKKEIEKTEDEKTKKPKLKRAASFIDLREQTLTDAAPKDWYLKYDEG